MRGVGAIVWRVEGVNIKVKYTQGNNTIHVEEQWGTYISSDLFE